MKLFRLLVFLSFAVVAFAQAGTPFDCTSVFTFTGTGAQAGQNNASSSAPCVAWRVTFTSTGFSSVTVKFQTSPDNTNWTDVVNSICSSTVQPPCVIDGANPLTDGVMGTSAFRAYGKYVRVNVTGTTGAGSGQVVTYGYKGTSASAKLKNVVPGGYYVDAVTGGGSDSNSGLFGHPWATLAHAAATVPASPNTDIHLMYPDGSWVVAPPAWLNISALYQVNMPSGGTAVSDISGNLGTGTINSLSGTGFIAARSSFVGLPRLTGIEGTNKDFSIVMIAAPIPPLNSSWNGGLWSYGTSTTAEQSAIYTKNGTNNLYFGLWGSAETIMGTYTTGQRTHIVTTKSGTTAKMYLGGSLTGTETLTGMNLTFAAGTHNLGRFNNNGASSFYADGNIELAIIYAGYVLTAGEIASMSAYDVHAPSDIPPAVWPTYVTRTWTVNPTPVLPHGSGAEPDASKAIGPAIWSEGGTQYVFYSGWDSGNNHGSVCLAQGPDLNSLVKQGAVLSHGTGGDWDSASAWSPNIAKYGSTYYMYYAGSQNTGLEAGPLSIGAATAPAITGPWTKTGSAILSPSAGWDSGIIYRAYSVFDGTTYYLCGNGKTTTVADDTLESIGCWTGSTPTGTYTQMTTNPLFTGLALSQSNLRVFDPTIYATTGGYIGLYTGQSLISGARTDNVGAYWSKDLTRWWDYGSWITGLTNYQKPSLLLTGSQWQALVDDFTNTFLATLN
jgi:hypothetical protein